MELATATIRFGKLYWFYHACFWAVDIMFDYPSILGFNNIAFIKMGDEKEEAQKNYERMKEYLESKGIKDKCRVNIKYDKATGNVAEIAKEEQWVDVHNGLNYLFE